MMKFIPPKSLLLPVIAVLYISACSNEQKGQAIGESYLNSEAYRQFERQSVKEHSGKSDEATVFERILTGFFTDPATEELKPPVRIDSLSVSTYLKSPAAVELKQSMINEPVRLNYTYYPIGTLKGGEPGLLFFLIRRPSIYDDVELAVATFKDTSLVGVRSLAEFKKTLSMKVGSNVEVGRSLNIISRIKRETFYPVPQEHNITYRYTIDGGGKIKEEVVSKES